MARLTYQQIMTELDKLASEARVTGRGRGGFYGAAIKEILSSLDLTDSSNWIIKWQLENTAKAYGTRGRMRAEEGGIPMPAGLAKYIPGLTAEPTGEWAQGSGQNIYSGIPPKWGPHPFQQPTYYRTRVGGASPAYISRGAPSWIGRDWREYAEEPLSKVDIPTPSGQQWSQMSPTLRAQLEGYAGYTGESFEDIMGEMERMKTKTPVGAGRTRWTPARQR